MGRHGECGRGRTDEVVNHEQMDTRGSSWALYSNWRRACGWIAILSAGIRQARPVAVATFDNVSQPSRLQPAPDAAHTHPLPAPAAALPSRMIWHLLLSPIALGTKQRTHPACHSRSAKTHPSARFLNLRARLGCVTIPEATFPLVPEVSSRPTALRDCRGND